MTPISFTNSNNTQLIDLIEYTYKEEMISRIIGDVSTPSKRMKDDETVSGSSDVDELDNVSVTISPTYDIGKPEILPIYTRTSDVTKMDTANNIIITRDNLEQVPILLRGRTVDGIIFDIQNTNTEVLTRLFDRLRKEKIYTRDLTIKHISNLGSISVTVMSVWIADMPELVTVHLHGVMDFVADIGIMTNLLEGNTSIRKFVWFTSSGSTSRHMCTLRQLVKTTNIVQILCGGLEENEEQELTALCIQNCMRLGLPSMDMDCATFYKGCVSFVAKALTEYPNPNLKDLHFCCNDVGEGELSLMFNTMGNVCLEEFSFTDTTSFNNNRARELVPFIKKHKFESFALVNVSMNQETTTDIMKALVEHCSKSMERLELDFHVFPKDELLKVLEWFITSTSVMHIPVSHPDLEESMLDNLNLLINIPPAERVPVKLE